MLDSVAGATKIRAKSPFALRRCQNSTSRHLARPRQLPMNVQLNDFKRQWEAVREDVQRAVARVGETGWYILGKEVEGFERALAEQWPAKQAVGVGNGLDAIEIGLRCLGVREGDRVVTTPLSAFATTLAIMRVGATPIFVDVH